MHDVISPGDTDVTPPGAFPAAASAGDELAGQSAAGQATAFPLTARNPAVARRAGLAPRRRYRLRTSAGAAEPATAGTPTRTPPAAGYTRSPVYVLSLVVGLTLIVVGFLISAALDDTIAGFVADVVDHTSTWPEAVRLAPAALALTTQLVVVVTLNGWLLVTRRFRRFILMNLAVALSSVLASALVLVMDSLSTGLGFERDAAAIFVPSVANVVAAATILRPWISTRAFRWLVIAAGWMGLAVVWSAGHTSPWAALPPLPVSVAEAQLSGAVAIIGVGITAGSLVALAFKTPGQIASPSLLVAALTRHGLDVAEVSPAKVDARGSRPWRGVTWDGRRLFIKTLSAEQRAADLLYRMWRALALKRSGDREPFTSLRRAVEHEAFLALAAASRSVRTPPLLAMGELTHGSFFLAYEELPGTSLDRLNRAELTDELVAQVFDQLTALRRSGIAHRDLRSANILIDAHGAPWIIDFGFAELTMDEELLDRDVAQLVAALGSQLGPERTTPLALACLGPERLAAGLAWLQPHSLGAATRHALGSDAAVHRLRERMRTLAGIEELIVPDVRRVSWRQMLMVGSLAAALVLLAGQISDFAALWHNLGEIDRRLVVLTLVASAATYVGATLGVMGAVAQRIRFLPTLTAQLASSFTNRLTPARLGGMATNVRFLIRRGVPGPAAVSAIGLNTVVGFGIHILMLSGAAWAAGRSPGEVSVPTPSAGTLMVLVAVIVVVSVTTYFTPFGNRLLREHLLPSLRAAIAAMVAVSRRPARLVQLIAGSVLVTGAYTIAMLFSLQAVGSDVGLAAAAFAYLAGSAVATAAPTPGGLGVVEATLVAVYAAIGVQAEVALLAVVLFRLATYWLPIVPGWLALNHLTRTGQL